MSSPEAFESRLLDLIGDVQGLLDLDELRSGLIVALRRAVPSDWVSLNELGPRPGDVWSLVVPPLAEDVYERFARYGYQNPLVQQAMRTQDGRAHRLSDVVSRSELHALELYREVYAPLGLEYQMAFTLPHAPGRLLGAALSRRLRDFDDAERDLVNRARPFLIQAYRNAVEYTASRGRSDGRSALVHVLRTAGLTAREADVVAQLALGRSNADAAVALGVSLRTVHKHLQHAFPKLGVRSRSEAAAKAWDLVDQAPG